MPNPWIPWSERTLEYAPVLAFHKHEPFLTTNVESFLDEHCELKIHVDTVTHSLSYEGPIFGRVVHFPTLPFPTKVALLLRKKFNKRLSYLDRHGDRIDMRASMEIQKRSPTSIYTRGFRNTDTGEAYITYWFFYVENFVPHATEDYEVAERLLLNPESLWTHEGDWEAMSVYFADHQDSHPTAVHFSQHATTQSIPWEDVNLEQGRILALVGLGTHATFNAPVRKRRLAFYAEIAQPDRRYYPFDQGQLLASAAPLPPTADQVYWLEALDPARHAWLYFKGRWGQAGGSTGLAPTGPLMKRKTHFQLLADQ